MPSFTSVPTKAPGDTITAAERNTMRDNDAVLNNRTGGDPPGAGYLLQSVSATASSWILKATALASYALLSGATFTGAVYATLVTWGTGGRRTDTAPASLDSIVTSGWYLAANGTTNNPTAADYLIEHVAHPVGAFHYQKAYHLTDGTQTYFRYNGGAGYTGWSKLWTELNDGPASGLAAQTAATATSAGTATTATSATSATQLAGVAAASYARLDAASDFTTAPTINGATIPLIASGSYNGNNVSTGRQITTGFACKLVMIYENSQNTTYLLNNTSEGMVLAQTGPTVGGSGDIHLHATDGFTVGDGTAQGNVTGRTYSYTAIG